MVELAEALAFIAAQRDLLQQEKVTSEVRCHHPRESASGKFWGDIKVCRQYT